MPLARLEEPYLSDPGMLLALCIWREARGQSPEAWAGVKHVILNRAANPKGPYSHCADVVSNILAPFQFSSFNPGTPEAGLLPNPAHTADFTAWLNICDLVDRQTADQTQGATHYFSVDIEPPAWASPEHFTVQIGAFRFFRL